MANFKLYFTRGKADLLVQLNYRNDDEEGADCFISELDLPPEALKAAEVLGKEISTILGKWDIERAKERRAYHQRQRRQQQRQQQQRSSVDTTTTTLTTESP